jgi:hypothetical protein
VLGLVNGVFVGPTAAVMNFRHFMLLKMRANLRPC